VTFHGSPGNVVKGWSIGWIQAQWIETNWAYYVGQSNTDGSIFLQRGRPPARPAQGCRDTSGKVSTIFTDPTDPREFQDLPGGHFPVTVRVSTNDPPGENYPLMDINGKTKKPNFLHTVQIEFHFATILTVRDPAGKFHHQAHFYWNLHWQYEFRPTAFPPNDAQWKVTPVAEGNKSYAAGAIPGAPVDHRFAGVLTSVQTQSCVDLAGASDRAVHTPGNACRREYMVWTSVDVRR